MSELTSFERLSRYRKTYLAMLLTSIASLGASLVLAIEAIDLAKNANAKFACDVNAIVSCGKVAKSWQSNLFGFPNPFLGLMLESVIITVAILGLSRVELPKRFLKVALIGYGAGFLFAMWLFSQSYFVIKAFCPWCLIVTISTITVFSTMLRVNLFENTFNLAQEKQLKVEAFLTRGWDHVIVAGIYTIMLTAVFFKYGKYFLPTIGG